MNVLQEFMILCSGANFHILRKTPSEWNKFSGIGGIIFFTAIFATLSAGYALFTIFDDFWIATGLGCLWGLMIFNLDRYIVSSIKKTEGWGKQLLMSIPRLVLAAFLGIVISKPLEIKIFEKEINKQLNTIIQRNKAELQSQMNNRILQQSTPFETEKNQLNAKIQGYQKAYDSAAVELEKEILGKASGLTSGKEGYGPNAMRKAELKEQRRLDLENYLTQVSPRLKYLDRKISEVYYNVESERTKTEVVEEHYKGLAARLQALEELGKKSKVMALASLFIMGLFIALEIAPVLVKLISGVGPYDYLLENTEVAFEIYAREQMSKSRMASEYRIKTYDTRMKK